MGEFNIPLNHYDLAGLAKSLQLTSIDVIKTSNMDIESHWFRSSGPADLYFWKTHNKIVKHQISLYGQVVEWNEFDGVKTGFVQDDEENYGADIVSFDKEINEAVVEQAIEFLSLVKIIDGKIRTQMIGHYSFYSRWPKMKIFRTLSRFFHQFRRKS